MQLRKYQNETICALRQAMKQNKKIILCLPTGAG